MSRRVVSSSGIHRGSFINYIMSEVRGGSNLSRHSCTEYTGDQFPCGLVLCQITSFKSNDFIELMTSV